MNILRIAICQLEAHPVVYSSQIAFLEEPFMPDQRDASLSHLGINGLNVDEAQAVCKATYVKWARIRLQAILDHLAKLNPRPDLVIFPECSMPIAHLGDVAKWTTSSSAIVLAGTHTPLSSAEAKGVYRDVGIDTGHVNRLTQKGRRNVLPLISAGKAKLIPKRTVSPYEQTIISPTTGKQHPFRATEMHFGEKEVAILPLICSDALTAPQLSGPIDVIAIASFDSKPKQFEAFCTEQVRNRRIVAYCNDGAYGGSRFFVAEDARIENWLSAYLPEGLPPGDAYLVADIDLDVRSVEVATAQPRRALQLIQIGSIVAEQSLAGRTASELREICLLPDSATRAQELLELLKRGSLLPLQQIRINSLFELEKRGSPSNEMWPVIGQDCVAKDLVPLRELEAQLAATCSSILVPKIAVVAESPQALALSLIKFLGACETRRGKEKPIEAIESSREVRSTINRDDEATQINQFLNNSRTRVLDVSGLPQVGKGAAIEKTLVQSGITRILRIQVNNSSSPEYILYSIIRYAGENPAPPYPDLMAIASGEPIARAIRSAEVIWLENAHELLEYGVWRDARIPAMIVELIKLVEQEGKKLIIETRREFPLDLEDPGIRARVRVHGLRDRFARALLDGQLRRVGLSPSNVAEGDKDVVIKKLDGHPVATAIAADAIYESGASEVVEQLRKRQGFFLNFLRSLIGKLKLAEEEETLLRVFCLARDCVPREVVAQAVGFNASGFMRNLLALGALELGTYGALRIAPILREYFEPEDLPRGIIEKFHSAAAPAFSMLSKQHGQQLAFAVEADYHGRIAGVQTLCVPNLIDSALAVAKQQYAAQKYDDAYEVIQQVLQARSRSHEAIRLAAQIQARRNRFTDAIAFAEEAFAFNRKDTWLLAELAKIALTLSRDDVAEQLIAVAERAAVEDTSILLVKGRMALRRKQLDIAVNCFDRARRLTERNAWPFFYLGRIYMQLGDIPDAIEVLFEGEEFIQNNNIRAGQVLSAIQTQLAYCYLFGDQLDLAEPLIMRLWEERKSPEVIRAYAALTIKKAGIAEAHKALEQLERAEIRNNYDRCQFHLLYGLFYLGINEPGKASAEFQKAHKADKTNVFVMLKLARTLLTIAIDLWTDRTGDHKSYVDDCTAVVREILRFDSDNREGINLMQDLYRYFKVEIKK